MMLTLHMIIISTSLIILGINANVESLLRGTPRNLGSKEIDHSSSSRQMQDVEGHHYVKMVNQTEEGLVQEVEVDEYGDEVGYELEQSYNEDEGFNGLPTDKEYYLYAEDEEIIEGLISNETNHIDQNSYYADPNGEELNEESPRPPHNEEGDPEDPERHWNLLLIILLDIVLSMIFCCSFCVCWNCFVEDLPQT